MKRLLMLLMMLSASYMIIAQEVNIPFEGAIVVEVNSTVHNKSCVNKPFILTQSKKKFFIKKKAIHNSEPIELSRVKRVYSKRQDGKLVWDYSTRPVIYKDQDNARTTVLTYPDGKVKFTYKGKSYELFPTTKQFNQYCK